MKTNVSVIVCVKGAEKYIGNCISSLLGQTFKNFEIVIIDDGSCDNTAHIIEKFSDERIRCFRNQKNIGIAKSRNKGLKLSRGEYIFFTDADCVVSKNWIEHGLKSLEDQKCVGVEGKIYYVSKEYKPTFSDHVCKNEHGGHFMTGNIAYKRSAIQSVGGFDEKYDYHEDRDLALRILKNGKIRFNPNMIVYVQQQTLTPKDMIRSACHIKNRVYLFKRFGERKLMLWRIVNPLNLAKALFPPLAFTSLFFNRFKTSDDYKLLPYKYVQAILERLQLWKTSAIERIFLI
jgi:glycosyltransferase involved in cell wall biosynthesis